MMNNNKQRLFEMMERINPDFKNNDNNNKSLITNNPKFIIPIGISGSGKSRWIQSIINNTTNGTNNTTIIISPDEIRRELTGNISDQTKNKEVFALAFERTINALNDNKSVIFDATNISSFHRKQMLDTLKQKVNREFDAFAKVFDVNPEISKQRISNDIKNGVDRSNVPPEAIDRQHKAFTADLQKIESDGFKIIDNDDTNSKIHDINNTNFKESDNLEYEPQDSDIDIARKTSITRRFDNNTETGRAISEAIVPKLAISLTNKNEMILDFGAGKHPYYVMKYRNEGYNIYGWDLPQSMEFWKQEYSNDEISPIEGLNNQFDLVYASNVMNVASNEMFLRRMTLDSIKKALKSNGIFIGNYPQSPRKNIELTPKLLYEILKEYFQEIKYDSKKFVFICKYLYK